MRPAAVLWDMDGTLVDTEPYWIDAEYALAERYGGTWSREHALNLVGNDLIESGRYIREHMGIDLEPSLIVEELLDRVIASVERAVPWRPGAVELLASLQEHGVPCALVTMSYRRFVAPILAALPEGTFAAGRHRRRRARAASRTPSRTSRPPRAGRGPAPTAWPSRTPTPAPGPPRPLAARCCASRTTCRCCPVTDGVFVESLAPGWTSTGLTGRYVSASCLDRS